MRSPGYALTCFILATLSLSCSLVDLRRSTDTDCSSEPAEFCTRLNDSQPPADACQSWTCNKATRFCDLGPRDLDADGAIDPECAIPGGTHPLDCDDTNANRFPDNPEVCDFIDNNCDNLTDENVYTVFDELTNDPNSMIPDTCPREDAPGATCPDGSEFGEPSPGSGIIIPNGLAFASRSNASDPQVVAAFIRPVDIYTSNDNDGLLGAALFDTAEWRFSSRADLDPEYQGIGGPAVKTMAGELNASSISVTALNDRFAIAAVGTRSNDTGVAADGIISFAAPPQTNIEWNEMSNVIDPELLPILPVITGVGEQALNIRVYSPPDVATLGLTYVTPSGDGCSINTPCLTTGASGSLDAIETDQAPAVSGIDNFGWLIAVADDNKIGQVVYFSVQADGNNALSVSALTFEHAPSGKLLSGLTLSQGQDHQLALGYVSDGRIGVDLLTLDISADPPALSIAHTLDLSSLPGTAHSLPQIVWHPLRKYWIVGTLDTPSRLFAVRFTQDGVLVDAEEASIFEARNLQPEIGFHIKPIEPGFAFLGYQLTGNQGNLLASKFGCSP